jgi:hypothetical protein
MPLKITPNVSKARGLQSRGFKGKTVGLLLRTLENKGSEVLWLSRRVKNMTKNDQHYLEFSNSQILIRTSLYYFK